MAAESAFLIALANDVKTASRQWTSKRATLILEMSRGAELAAASLTAGMSADTAKRWVREFNAGGWTALLTVLMPRGGDYLARYDIGFWAETLASEYLSRSRASHPLPYGTSVSKPFTDMSEFRRHVETEFRLRAWSAGGQWKRPDLLVLPKDKLRALHTGRTPPDLKVLDNTECEPFVAAATAALEVETSLWNIGLAEGRGKPLSFTVKEEDLGPIRKWVSDNTVPLYVFQVFYDRAFALPFTTLESAISLPRGHPQRVEPVVDEVTGKATYFVPLDRGVQLGTIDQPSVEGRVFTADTGKVFVYGCLTGSRITGPSAIRERLAAGTLMGVE